MNTLERVRESKTGSWQVAVAADLPATGALGLAGAIARSRP